VSTPPGKATVLPLASKRTAAAFPATFGESVPLWCEELLRETPEEFWIRAGDAVVDDDRVAVGVAKREPIGDGDVLSW